MIRTVHENQTQLVKDIQNLYLEDCPFELDPTYGKGGLYKNGGTPALIKMDLEQKRPGVAVGDVKNLDISSGSIKSIIFDPPFLAGGGRSGIMHSHFSSFSSIPALFEFYFKALSELLRVLKKGGILAFKCQDLTNGRTQNFSHCEVYEMALDVGFYARDLFILVNRNLPKPHNLVTQHHARKAHSYFWVFEKCNKKNKRARAL